ncbi:MAG: NAD(P)H-dependent glycerol-3-phosphate dehydrogenase [Puniceicoccales bacterium]|jgi:glycerol-3-phosphate dehydrogenase (NAD(P)+)|nr:NAD(P)H-dependent glycerol-3-phosphate dehydrogenase [Puniceicoccales bacterium]
MDVGEFPSTFMAKIDVSVPSRAKCVVLGAGAWGTAVAIHLAARGQRVTLVPRDEAHARRMLAENGNMEYVPGIHFPKNLQISSDFAVVRDCHIAFFACPSAGIVEFCQRVRAAFSQTDSSPKPFLVTLCKGLVPDLLRLPLSIVRETLPAFPCGVLSGPTHALDVAQGLPTAAVLAAGAPAEMVQWAQAAINAPNFRVYMSTDTTGVELGGCLKNPYAIGIGLAAGINYGDNGRAALLTRMMAELVRIGVALGGAKETFYGLSGLGDLFATANGRWSRNRMFGERVGRGEFPEMIIQSQKSVVEGYGSAKHFYKICREKDLCTPILDEIYTILYENGRADCAFQKFMSSAPEWE